MRRLLMFRSILSWKLRQASPKSRVSFWTVFLATPEVRQVAATLQPSTRARTTAQRFSSVSLFILTIMLDRSSIVNSQRIKKAGHFVPPFRQSVTRLASVFQGTAACRRSSGAAWGLPVPNRFRQLRFVETSQCRAADTDRETLRLADSCRKGLWRTVLCSCRGSLYSRFFPTFEQDKDVKV